MPCLGEIADTLHISDDAGQIIHILAVTFGTFMQIPFVDMMAFVTYCIRYIEHLTGGSALHMNLEEHLSKEQYRQLLRVAATEGCNYFTFNIPNTVCNIRGKSGIRLPCPISRVSHPHFRQESFRS